MNDIVCQFVNAKATEQKEHYFYNPDTELYLLSVHGAYFDDALFVLVETDHFDANYAESAIKEKFQPKSIEWVQPNQKKIISIRNHDGEYIDAVDLTATHNNNVFALALIADRTLHEKYLGALDK